MKIVSLNTWHGKLLDDLRRFIKEQAKDTDVFCFQEMTPEDAQRICMDILGPEFFLTFSFKLIDEHQFAVCTFVRRQIKVMSHVSLYDGDGDAGAALVVELAGANGSIFVCSVHGLPEPGSKLDTPERLHQSRDIIEYFASVPGPKIVMGDFNLMPQTGSVQMFKNAGYKNLIEDFAIKTTRNHYAWDRFPDSEQLFADYTFVSPEVNVTGFRVLDDNVADHLAMQLRVDWT